MRVVFLQWDNSASARQTAARLAPGEVHVWTARIPADASLFAASDALLAADEKTRGASFKSEPARRQYVFGRLSLRQLLGACANINPAALAFAYQARGKPHILAPAPASGLRFNLSHSGKMLAIAVSWGREVGVDLECLDSLADWAELAERIFSRRELAMLNSLDTSLQRQAFFNGWTRKEAWLKATGEGLIDNLASIEVSLTPRENPHWLHLPGGEESLRRWGLRALPLPADYTGAVVFEHSQGR